MVVTVHGGPGRHVLLVVGQAQDEGREVVITHDLLTGAEAALAHLVNLNLAKFVNVRVCPHCYLFQYFNNYLS